MKLHRLIIHWFRSWLGVTCLTLLVACGGGDNGSDSGAPVVPARAGSADISSAGGSVDAVLDGGATVRLDIPPGAIASTTTYRIDPVVPSGGTLGALKLAPANVTLHSPATLTVAPPAGATLDPDVTLAFDIGTGLIPFSTALDPAARTLTVQLTSTPTSPTLRPASLANGRAHALASGPTTDVSVLVTSVNMPHANRLVLLEHVVSDLLAQGSIANAQIPGGAVTVVDCDGFVTAANPLHRACDRGGRCSGTVTVDD